MTDDGEERRGVTVQEVEWAGLGDAEEVRGEPGHGS